MQFCKKNDMASVWVSQRGKQTVSGGGVEQGKGWFVGPRTQIPRIQEKPTYEPLHGVFSLGAGGLYGDHARRKNSWVGQRQALKREDRPQGICHKQKEHSQKRGTGTQKRACHVTKCRNKKGRATPEGGSSESRVEKGRG